MFAENGNSGKKALFVFAHMDDETISSYGTIRRMLDEGFEVALFCMCGSGRRGGDVRSAELRRRLFMSYGDFGVKVETAAAYDLNLAREDVQFMFDRAVTEHNPNIVVTHWPRDLHFEHRLLGEAALVSCRRKVSEGVRQLLYVSSPSERWTFGVSGASFTPNFFVDIGKYRSGKLKMLHEYSKCELPPPPDARSAESVMDYDRINGSVAGLAAPAESYFKAFEVV